MKVQQYGRGILAVCAATALTLGSVAVSAQEASPEAGAMAIPAGCEVVASGLFNPRYVEVGEDGTLYVTEAGDAGEEAVMPNVGEGTPPAAEAITMRGPSGQATMVTADGTQTVLATGLSSYTFGSEIVGPAGIVLSNGTIFVAVGGPGPNTPLVDAVATQNSVVAIDPATGTVTTVADIGAYEIASNPDPNAIDSDLYGIGAAADGTLYVADAGGNAVYTVDPTSGEFSLFAVIPGIPTPDGPANPARGGAQELDPVPTGIEVGADGTVYVSLLSGGPFIPGTAKVQAIAPDGTVSDYAAGLTMLADITTGPDGAVYVSQLSDNFLAGDMPAPGSVVRINADGSTETVLSDLFLANGIDFGPDGSLYVVINASAPQGTPPMGQVLKCDIGAAAAPAASPAADEAAGGSDAAAASDVALSAIDIAFDQKEITITANTDSTITVTNNGAAAHDFAIDDLGVKTAMLNPGQSETVTINADAGEYQYHCTVPGHAAAGMVGKLIVE